MTALAHYKEYWDEWHRQWYQFVSTGKGSDIKGWSIPRDKGGNKCPACEYFPEPYWGNSNAGELKALFLNINPGEGSDEQNLKKSTLSKLKDSYAACGQVYSDTVRDLCGDRYYVTTKWMNEKRVKWLGALLGDEMPIDIAHILLGDLIPWHTKSKSDISQYIQNKENAALIAEAVIVPLAQIAKDVSGPLQSTVVVRSSLLLDLLNKSEELRRLVGFHKEYVVLDDSGTFSKLSSFLTVVSIEGADFFVFSGGASMLLPRPSRRVVAVGEDSTDMKLSKFLLTKPFKKASAMPLGIKAARSHQV